MIAKVVSSSSIRFGKRRRFSEVVEIRNTTTILLMRMQFISHNAHPLLCLMIKSTSSSFLCIALLWVPSFALALLEAFFSLAATPVLIISIIVFSSGENPAISRMTALTSTALLDFKPFLRTGLFFHA